MQTMKNWLKKKFPGMRTVLYTPLTTLQNVTLGSWETESDTQPSSPSTPTAEHAEIMLEYWSGKKDSQKVIGFLPRWLAEMQVTYCNSIVFLLLLLSAVVDSKGT